MPTNKSFTDIILTAIGAISGIFTVIDLFPKYQFIFALIFGISIGYYLCAFTTANTTLTRKNRANLRLLSAETGKPQRYIVETYILNGIHADMAEHDPFLQGFNDEE